jgi:murein L,D-transpeptidase YafK
MTTKEFIEKYKDTKEIVSMQYQSGPFDNTLTAYPKGITNPHMVEFRSTSFTNWKRMMDVMKVSI